MTQTRHRLLAIIGVGLLVLVLLPWLPYLGKNIAYLDALRFLAYLSQEDFFTHPAHPLTPFPWRVA